MQVGRTKDQGLYNKPSAAVHPGALADGALPQYNTIQLSDILHNIRKATINKAHCCVCLAMLLIFSTLLTVIDVS